MLAKLARLIKNEDGATAIEYGLIAALIAVAAVAGFTNFGSGLSNMWNGVSTTMDSSAA